MFLAAIPAQAATMQAQAWPRLWPAGCESHLHPWAEHKLVPRPSTCCSTRRSRWTAAAQQGYHQGLYAASRETDQLLLAPLVKAAYWHNFQKSCSLHRSCFWHRVHELLSAQVNPSGTGSGWLHRLGSGRRCMSMFCMLYRLEVCDKPHHSLEVKHCCQGNNVSAFLLRSCRACAEWPYGLQGCVA